MKENAVKLGVAALLYVGIVSSVFAAIVVVYAVVEQAWGFAGVAGIVAAMGSMVCGLEAAGAAKKRGEFPVRRLALLSTGAIVLMFAGAILVVVQLG